MEHLVHLTERCRWFSIWRQADSKNRECVAARYRGGCLFSWLQTGHFTPVSSLLCGRISSAFCSIKKKEKLGGVSPVTLVSFTGCNAGRFDGSVT